MEKETPWIDAWIRWERNSKEIVNEDEDDDDDDDERVPPTKEFSFTYRLNVCDADERPSQNHLDLTLSLKGFPSESEQIWNSTGLTLWPSSHYLCEYLLDHYRKILVLRRRIGVGENRNTATPETITDSRRTIRAIELGSGLGRCGLLLHHLLKCQTNTSSHVYLTDGDTDTLAQLRDNVMDNTESASFTEKEAKDPQQLSHSHGISCHQLLWGKDSTQSFCVRHLKRSSNEKAAIHSSGVDLVFGSDLIYAPQVINPLFETVVTLLNNSIEGDRSHDTTAASPAASAQEKPIFLMAHSDRREGSSVTFHMVLEASQNAGLTFEILETIEREGIYILAFTIQNP